MNLINIKISKKFIKFFFVLIAIIVLVFPSIMISYDKSSGNEVLNTSNFLVFNNHIAVTLYLNNYSNSNVSSTVLGRNNFSSAISLNINGANMNVSSGSRIGIINCSAYKQFLFPGNPFYPSDPLNSNISSSSKFYGNLKGSVYNTTYGNFYSNIISLNFNIGGNGSMNNPATGFISSTLQEGKLHGGGITFSEYGNLQLGGTISYISTQISSLSGTEKVIMGGEKLIVELANWLSKYPNPTKLYNYNHIEISFSVNLERTSLSFIPDYRDYIISGVLTAILPLGIVGIIYLSESKKWKNKNSLLIELLWTVTCGIFISNFIIYYYFAAIQ